MYLSSGTWHPHTPEKLTLTARFTRPVTGTYNGLLCGCVWLQVQGKCRGQQTCAVAGSEVTDPCVGTYKYAKAIYTCEEITPSGARIFRRPSWLGFILAKTHVSPHQPQTMGILALTRSSYRSTAVMLQYKAGRTAVVPLNRGAVAPGGGNGTKRTWGDTESNVSKHQSPTPPATFRLGRLGTMPCYGIPVPTLP